MADDRTPLVYVEKDGEMKTHFARQKTVTWNDGSTSLEMLPACGTRVDVTALYSYRGWALEASCGRCVRH